jgi:DNA mismatch repair protein MutS
MFRDDVREKLASVHDIERLLTKIIYQTCSSRDLKALQRTLEAIPYIKALLCSCESPQLSSLGEKLYELEEVCALIATAIVDDPPFSVREGGFIAKGYNNDVDELNLIIKDSKSYIAAIEQSERELTGIKNLKVGYNRVFGYYIEVTKSFLANVPDRYIRRQTLTGAERYVTEELKDVEGKVLGAKDRIQALEYELFVEICDKVRDVKEQLQQNAVVLSTVDAYASLGICFAGH